MTLPVEYNAADSQREIDALQQQLTRMEQFLRMQPLSAAPINPEEGYIAVSDGTGSGFDSVNGAGAYRFNGSVWVPLDNVKFTSTEQTITSAGLLTLAHGITGIPLRIYAHLVNKTAEHNYSVGDKIRISPAQSSTATNNDKGVSVVPDTTNLNIRFASASSPFNILNKTTGVGEAVTNANWKIVFEAKI